MKTKLSVVMCLVLVLSVMGWSLSLIAHAEEKPDKLVIVGTPQAPQFYQTLGDLFEERYGVKVETHFPPREEFDSWFKARMVAKVQVDLVQGCCHWWAPYYSTGLVQPVTWAFGDPEYPNLNRDRFRTGFLQAGTIKGEIIDVPLNIITTLFYYNKKIFDKYGIPVPKTLDDMYTVKDKLEGTRIYPLAYAGKEIWWNPMFVFTLVHMITENNAIDFTIRTLTGEKKYTDPVYVTALRILDEWKKKGLLVPESMGFDYSSLASAFLRGRIAMIYQGTWFYTEAVRPALPEGFELGVFPVPDLSLCGGLVKGFGQPAGPFDVVLRLSGTTKYKKWATKFIDFAASGEAAEILVKLGYLSALKGVEPTDPILRQVAEMYEGVPIVRFLDNYWEPEIIDGFQVEVQRMLLGETTPEQAAATIEKAHQLLLDEGRDFGSLFAE